jgi:hypothetical protein
MSRGGARPGAGRPKGKLSAKTEEMQARIAAEGITPLEVMLTTMRKAWDKGDETIAMSAAKDAAPYVHPRLIAQDNKADLSQHYMARAPLPAPNDETWQAQHSPTIQ